MDRVAEPVLLEREIERLTQENYSLKQNARLTDLMRVEPGFYCEWVYYENEEDKQKAQQYLQLWKHFIQRKLKGLELKQEQIVDKPNIFGRELSTLGIKVEMR